jgi:oligopeptidase B
MGAVVNMRPDLFNAAIAAVPFVDVINTMSDPSIPLTVIEWEQWGNPADKTYLDYIRSYSPYDNVARTAYPHMLVTAGLNDPRVAYWEPLKWVAKLRSFKTDDHLLLLKVNTEAGHSGASGRYDHLKDDAFEYAFLLHVTPAIGEED